jgi:hypothetical protein
MMAANSPIIYIKGTFLANVLLLGSAISINAAQDPGSGPGLGSLQVADFPEFGLDGPIAYAAAHIRWGAAMPPQLAKHWDTFQGER